MAAPATSIYATITPFSDDISQTAEDGFSNLIFTGNNMGTTQTFVSGNKTDGTYNLATAKTMSLNGVTFTNQIADATSVIKGEGSIGNTIWNDVNADGIKDAGEFGISNAVVELWEDINNNAIIDIVTDKLEGSAITDNAGNYSFIKVLPGNYLIRPVMTTSVNYPAQSFSASYPFNQLAGAGVALSDAGDETIGGSSTTNSVNRNFSTINFNDQTADFGFTGSFTVLANNNLTLKTNYANGSVILNWTYTASNNEKNYCTEKSVDGINFSAIENGTITNFNINKTSIDKTLPTNIFMIYYRVKIIDNVGQVKYSNIEKVNITKSKNEAVIVFPNPAKDNVTLLLPSNFINKKIFLTITNSTGQIIKTISAKPTNTNFIIDLLGFKKGTYFWSICLDNEKNIYSQGKLRVL